MKKQSKFEKLELGGEIIKLAPVKEKSLDIFELNNDRNKFQEDFEQVISLNPINTRENIILNYGIEQGKIEGNKDFNKILKAILEAYPKSKSEYVDYDVYCRNIMDKFISSSTNWNLFK